jgi:hypothetical protein
MKTLTTTVALAATLFGGLAVAQPDLKIQDRHPAMAGEPLPKSVRTIPIGPVHTFEQRWEPVEQLLREQREREHLQGRPSAPAAPAVRTAAIVPAAKPVFRPPPDICQRHGLRKVYSDRHRWRCR